MKINYFGLMSVILPCLIGSVTYSIIIYYHFNDFGGFSISLIDVILLSVLLLFLSAAISIPLVFYVRFSIRNQPFNSRLFKKLNVMFLIYALILYLFFSNLMSNYKEGLELTTAYIISGFISLNFFLSKNKFNLKHK